MRKLLFLDFDGVLNSWDFIDSGRKESQEKYIPWDSGCLGFDTQAIKNLNEIISYHQVDIIISATMRKYKSLDEINSILKQHGICKEAIAVTPDFSYKKEYTKSHTLRGEEIRSYLKENDHIIILDDDSDFGKLKPWLLKTSMDFGLTSRNIEDSKNIFSLVPSDIIKNKL